MWASRRGRDKVVKLLIEAGAQVDIRDKVFILRLYYRGIREFDSCLIFTSKPVSGVSACMHTHTHTAKHDCLGSG